MLRKRVAAADSNGINQLLGRQPLRDLCSFLCRQSRHRLELREFRFSFLTNKGECSGLGFFEVNTKAGLEQLLLLGQEILLEEDQFKGFPRLIVLDNRRNASEPS